MRAERQRGRNTRNHAVSGVLRGLRRGGRVDRRRGVRGAVGASVARGELRGATCALLLELGSLALAGVALALALAVNGGVACLGGLGGRLGGGLLGLVLLGLVGRRGLGRRIRGGRGGGGRDAGEQDLVWRGTTTTEWEMTLHPQRWQSGLHRGKDPHTGGRRHKE